MQCNICCKQMVFVPATKTLNKTIDKTIDKTWQEINHYTCKCGNKVKAYGK